MKSIKLLIRAMIDFWRDDCFTHAAAISYFALMSLFPLLIIIISVLISLLGTAEEVNRHLVPFFKTFFPQLDPSMIKELKRISGAAGLLNVINGAIFFWMAIQVFYSIEYAINMAFKTKKLRTFIYTTILSILMVVLSGILYFISTSITSVTRLLKDMKMDLADIPYIDISINFLLIHDTLINYIIPFTLVFLSLVWIYKFLPNTKVALSNAGRGALLTAILWEAAKHLFTWYMGNVAHYKSLYGSLTTIVVFLSWIYYSAYILLYGAEVVYQLGSQKRHVTLRKQAVRR